MSALVRHSSRQKETRNGLSAVGLTSYTTRPRNRHRYCGKEKDNESGLYYYGARYYESWTCRFVSVDPLAERYAQLSSYNYADNSPVTDLDVDGLQSTNSDTSQGSANKSDSSANQNLGYTPTAKVTGINPDFKRPAPKARENENRQKADATNIVKPVKSKVTNHVRKHLNSELDNSTKPDATKIASAPKQVIGDRKRTYDQEFGYVLRNTMGGASGNSYLPDAKYTEIIEDLVSYLGAYNPAQGLGDFTAGVIDLYNEVAAIVKSYLIGKELEKQEKEQRKDEPSVNYSQAAISQQSYSVNDGTSIVTLGIHGKDTTLVKGPGVPANPFNPPANYSKGSLNKKNRSLIHNAYPKVIR